MIFWSDTTKGAILNIYQAFRIYINLSSISKDDLRKKISDKYVIGARLLELVGLASGGMSVERTFTCASLNELPSGLSGQWASKNMHTDKV